MTELKGRVNGIIANIQAGRFAPTPGCHCYACRRERRNPGRRS
jgi:hypothetical protein